MLDEEDMYCEDMIDCVASCRLGRAGHGRVGARRRLAKGAAILRCLRLELRAGSRWDSPGQVCATFDLFAVALL